MLSADELARYGAAVDRGVALRTGGDPRPFEERSRYEQSFLQCINLWEDCEDVRPLTFHQRIAGAAAELLGVPAIRIWHDQALYKEPGGRGTDPHHDQAYWPLAEANTITAWIAFDGADLENGCMGYVPGSHRFGEKRAFPNIFTGTGYDLEKDDVARGMPPRFEPVRPGDVAFHHGLTIHCAKPNMSARTRRTHTMIYFADGSTRRRASFTHPSVDRAGSRWASPCEPRHADRVPARRGRSPGAAAAPRAADPGLAGLDARGVRVKPTPHPWSRDFAWQPPRGAFRRIDARQARSWDEHGYFVLEDAFDPATMARGDRRDRSVRARVGSVPAQAARRKMLHRPGRQDHLHHPPGRALADLREFAATAVLRSVPTWSAPTCGSTGTRRCTRSRARAPTSPGTRTTATRSSSPSSTSRCWVALTDATEENGCPRVVPGLHRRGTLRASPTDLGLVLDDPDPPSPRRPARGASWCSRRSPRTAPDRT